jgi:hypothetical protein
VNYQLRYLGKSELRPVDGGAQALAFSPNLARNRVFFDAEIREPLRFREAMSALHDVVIGDLRQKKKDRSAWLAWKEQQQREEGDLRRAVLDRARVDEARKIRDEPIPPNLEPDFRRMHRLYWDARVRWANELSRDDPALFRALVPCDPVVTVAPDAVFFECFAKDESAYGCLTVARDAFGGESASGLGTTNVDYSLALYEHFQTLRTYRATRLLVDPSGFEVATRGASGVREEKIDLPPSWLRGFGQLQAAMALPSTRVELSVDVVYSLLAWLKRHREKTGPRSLRLRLSPGAAPVVVIDPWGVELRSRAALYDGAVTGEIKLWGRRRLMSLARLLPITEKFEVLVFGSGLPSIWLAHMGEMRFVLGLSGWTANDWTRGSNLDTFFAGFEAPPGVPDGLARYLETVHSARLDDLERQIQLPRRQVLAGLHALAKRGQVVYDYAVGLYRWRPLLPVALSETLLGPESEELATARRIVSDGQVKLERDESMPGGRRLLVAHAGGVACEGVVDLDGAFRGAKCSCSFFYKNRLRAGPCRHLLALRMHATQPAGAGGPEAGGSRRQPASEAPERAPRQVLFHLPEVVVAALQQEAARRGLVPSDIAEQAWRIARTRVQQAARIDELSADGPPAGASAAYRAIAKSPMVLAFSATSEQEIQREAARLDATVSQVFAAAWYVAHDVMRFTSSLLS